MKRGWTFTASARAIAMPSLPADGRRLDVEVVEHFDVIAEEADGAEERGRHRRQTEVVADVGLEPRILGASAAALVDEAKASQSVRPSARAMRLADAIRLASHGYAAAIAFGMLCAVKTSRAPVAARVLRQLRRGAADVIGVGLDEAGMLVPVANVDDVDRRAAAAGRLGAGIADVLLVHCRQPE